MGKMIDAQSIVVASTATNWFGHEGTILRFVFKHSIALACLVGVLVMLQAYVFTGHDREVSARARVVKTAKPCIERCRAFCHAARYSPAAKSPGKRHEQDPGPGTIRQDRRQLPHLDAARAGQKPGAAGRPHLAAEKLARARRRHRRRPRRLHLRAACRAHVGDRHHPGNARHGEGRSAKARPRQCAHDLRQGRGAAVRGRELRPRHLPHRAASLRLRSRNSSARCTACSSRTAFLRWSTMWCRPAASATTSTPSSASATPATCGPGPSRNGARHSTAPASRSRTKSSFISRWNSRAGPPATTPTCRPSCARCWRELTPEVKAALEPKGAGPDLTFRLSEGLFIATRA